MLENTPDDELEGSTDVLVDDGRVKMLKLDEIF